MTLVNYDEAVRLSDFGQIFTTSEALCHRDIDGALCLVAAAAELTDLLCGHPEVLSETLTPLLDQRLPIDHYECGELAVGNDSAGDHGLTRTWRRHEYTEMMWNERIQCTLLTACETGLQRDIDRLGRRARVGDFEIASGISHHASGLFRNSAWNQELIDGLSVAA